MTSTLAPPTAVRRRSLVPVVVLAAAGPTAVAVLRGVLPYSTNDDPLTAATSAAAHPGAQSAVLWLSYLALLTLPLGVVIVGRAAVRAHRVLGGIAAGLTWVGYASLFWLAAPDQLAAAGLPPTEVAAAAEGIGAHPTQSVAAGAFVIGHIVGTVLLGVALWRAVPRWAAVALIASQPLHLVFAVVVPNHLLDACAWALTAAGFAVAAGVRR
ncbi:hypothetical protein [Pseudonocardia oroxyli]|nr:hypothetical protein [Pseudonocardia oroxyli]